MESGAYSSEGRSKSFEDQIIKHLDSLYAVALRLTRNPVDAQDLLQDSMVRALRFHNQYKEGTYIKAWLVTILRNTFINDYRKKLRRPVLVEWNGVDGVPYKAGDAVHSGSSWDVLELLDDPVRAAVDALPEGHRLTVIMADLKNMSYREIAEEMECPLGTVMSRLHRGRRLIRETLVERRQAVSYS